MLYMSVQRLLPGDVILWGSETRQVLKTWCSTRGMIDIEVSGPETTFPTNASILSVKDDSLVRVCHLA